MVSPESPEAHLLPDQIRWVIKSDYVFELSGKETPAGFTWILSRRGASPPVHREVRWVPFASGELARCYVAYQGEAPVGYVEFSLESQARVAKIHLLVVREDWRQKGVGRTLVGVVEQAAAHSRSGHVIVGCTAENVPAIEALRRLGYQIWGVSSTPGSPSSEVKLTIGKEVHGSGSPL